MELIKKIGLKPYFNKEGKFTQNMQFGIFECPYCKNHVEKPLSKGSRDKTCGSVECKAKQMKKAQQILAEKNKANPDKVKLFKTGDLMPSNRKSRLNKIYQSWSGMKNRCYNPNNARYHRYGGRGITVCDRWKDSFENFYDDMQKEFFIMLHSANGISKMYPTIHRIDSDGNYEPSNCKWLPKAYHAQHDGIGKGIKAVEAYNLETGKVIKQYKSLTDASLEPVIMMFAGTQIIKYPQASKITEVCKGRNSQHLGIGWRYIDTSIKDTK